MKVLLLQDVYNLGKAGEIKKVASGYGRNYLIPQKLATLATPTAIKRADYIRVEADKRRAVLNQEMGIIADQLKGLQLLFSARAGETGKLYGSITTAMIAEEISGKTGLEINKRQIDSQPLRQLGMHIVNIRLTVDLIPEITVIVYREGESPENYMFAADEYEAEAMEDEDILEEDIESEVDAESEVAEEEVSE